MVCELIIFSVFLLCYVIFFFPSISRSEEKGKDAEKIVITAEEIKKMNVRSIVELLNQIPGVTAGDSSVSIRGSYMVRVLVDGRPINDPLSAHRSIRWALVSLENIEKIEIYKGGGAVLFGDDTSGGVISIKTKEVKGSQGNIEIFGGNFDTQSYSLNYQQVIGASSVPPDVVGTSNGPKPLGIGVSAGWYTTDSFRPNGDKDKKRIGAKVDYKPGKIYDFDLSLDYSEEERGMPGLPAFPTPKARTESNTFGSSLISKIGALKSGTYFSTFEKEHTNPERNLETILKSWSIKQDLKSPIPISRYGSIDTGLNFEIARIRGNKIESQQEEKYGLYTSKEIPFEDIPIKFGLGLRWNFYSEYDQALNPEFKVGFDWDSFGLQLSVLKTNNTPTFLHRYYESSRTIPNPDLGMEKAINYNITTSYHLDPSFEANVSLFFNKIEDRITYVRGDDGIGSYENLGEVTLKGTECSMKWKPYGFLEIRPSYIYLSARDKLTGKWLPCKPEHRIKLDLQYRPFHDLTLALNTKYVSEQYTRSDNKESVPGYFLTGFRGDYYLKKIRLFLKIENLFDKDYYYGDGYPAPPLTWNIGLNYEF
ncbi:MAG: TonB-dependent receptor [Deltaproteobacteria bacterium]|nr:TonB-dependent receptor [Deltaproteobacteria bacterium]